MIEEDYWTWDWQFSMGQRVLFKNSSYLEVMLNPADGEGTAVVRGNKALDRNCHHYWEILITSMVSGTDVMIGVGTSKVQEPTSVSRSCVSLLGIDSQSWGYSYQGYVQHGGLKVFDCNRRAADYHRGRLVGVYYNGWKETLKFYLDRIPLDITLSVKDKILYPMACSTAVLTKLSIVNCVCITASLQMECLAVSRAQDRAYLSENFPALRHLTDNVLVHILTTTHGGGGEPIDCSCSLNNNRCLVQ